MPIKSDHEATECNRSLRLKHDLKRFSDILHSLATQSCRHISPGDKIRPQGGQIIITSSGLRVSFLMPQKLLLVRR